MDSFPEVRGYQIRQFLFQNREREGVVFCSCIRACRISGEVESERPSSRRRFHYMRESLVQRNLLCREVSLRDKGSDRHTHIRQPFGHQYLPVKTAQIGLAVFSPRPCDKARLENEIEGIGQSQVSQKKPFFVRNADRYLRGVFLFDQTFQRTGDGERRN